MDSSSEPSRKRAVCGGWDAVCVEPLYERLIRCSFPSQDRRWNPRDQTSSLSRVRQPFLPLRPGPFTRACLRMPRCADCVGWSANGPSVMKMPDTGLVQRPWRFARPVSSGSLRADLCSFPDRGPRLWNPDKGLQALAVPPSARDQTWSVAGLWVRSWFKSQRLRSRPPA